MTISIYKRRENFFKKAKLVHNDKYDYHLTTYKHSHKKVKIICPVYGHGKFEQQPSNHLSGNGCPKCKLVKLRTNLGSYNFTTFAKNPELSNKISTLYLIKYRNLHKVGITTRNTFQRFNNNKSVQIISEVTNLKLIDAFIKEQEILKQYSEYKQKPINWHYDGSTEFININIEQKNQIIIDFFTY